MRGFYLATKPIVDVFNFMGNLVLRPFGIPPAAEAGHAPHSEDELRSLLRESREGGLIERDEQRLSEAALVFGDRRAREAMTPRWEIDYVTTDQTPREVAEKAMRSGHTGCRCASPIAGRGRDRFHQRQGPAAGGVRRAPSAPTLIPSVALRRARRRGVADLRRLARPRARVAESTRLDEVLREMRHDRRHLALVLDEHGTVAGG